MCIKKRKVYTVCGHVKIVNDICETAEQGTCFGWYICFFSKRKISFRYDFCPSCADSYDIRGYITESMVLNYWGYKNKKGWTESMPAGSVPSEELFRRHSGIESPASIRGELISLINAIKGETMGLYKGVVEGLKYVQKIRAKTVEVARKNTETLVEQLSGPSPQPVMVMLPMNPSSPRKKRSHDSFTLAALEGRGRGRREEDPLDSAFLELYQEIHRSETQLRTPQTQDFAEYHVAAGPDTSYQASPRSRRPQVRERDQGRLSDIPEGSESSGNRITSTDPDLEAPQSGFSHHWTEQLAAHNAVEGQMQDSPRRCFDSRPSSPETGSPTALTASTRDSGSDIAISVYLARPATGTQSLAQCNPSDRTELLDGAHSAPRQPATAHQLPERQIRPTSFELDPCYRLPSSVFSSEDASGGSSLPDDTSYQPVRSRAGPALQDTGSFRELVSPRSTHSMDDIWQSDIEVTTPMLKRFWPDQPFEFRVVPPKRRWSEKLDGLEKTILPGCFCEEEEIRGTKCVPCTIRAREKTESATWV